MLIRALFALIILALLMVPAVQRAIALGIYSRFNAGLLF